MYKATGKIDKTAKLGEKGKLATSTTAIYNPAQLPKRPKKPGRAPAEAVTKCCMASILLVAHPYGYSELEMRVWWWGQQDQRYESRYRYRYMG